MPNDVTPGTLDQDGRTDVTVEPAEDHPFVPSLTLSLAQHKIQQVGIAPLGEVRMLTSQLPTRLFPLHIVLEGE